MMSNNLLLLTDDESDEDDEMMEKIAEDLADDEEFFVKFRLTKETVLELFARIEEDIAAPTNQNRAVPTRDRLLFTLRFYATGSMLTAARDFPGIHKSTAGAIVRKVSTVIARLCPDVIRFPKTAEEIAEVRQGFFEVAKFPSVIGVIDCTHVKIKSFGDHPSEPFRNRKGDFTLNIQMICASDLRIQDISARWPGSTTDRTIFNHSRIKYRFENGEFNDGLLLGDSNYASSHYMMVPLRKPKAREEQLFNESQIRTRLLAERLHADWKERFPILTLGMDVSLDDVMAIIVATAVLHNLACDAQEEVPKRELGLGIDPESDAMSADVASESMRGDVRSELVGNYFKDLLQSL